MNDKLVDQRATQAPYHPHPTAVDPIRDMFISLCSKTAAAGSPDEKMKHIKQMRTIISEDPHPIEAACNTGVVQVLLTELSRVQVNPELALEAIWAITNICTGTTTQTRHVVEMGGVPVLVRYTAHPDSPIKEQAAWALGNIAGDSKDFKILILRAGGLQALLGHCTPYPNVPSSVVVTASWAISNLVRDNLEMADKLASEMTGVFRLLSHPDREVVQNAMWTLSYLSEGSQLFCKKLASSTLQLLVQAVSSGDMDVLAPTLRILSNVAKCDGACKDAVIASGVLQSKCMQQSGNPGTSREAVRKQQIALLGSLVTNAEPRHIQAVVASPAIYLLRHKDPDSQYVNEKIGSM